MQIKERLGVETIGQLREHPLTTLERMFGSKTGWVYEESFVVCSQRIYTPSSLPPYPPFPPPLFSSWLYDLCRGIDHEPVRPRKLAQSIGCGKNFRGKEKLDTVQKVCVSVGVGVCVCMCVCVCT